MKNVFTVHRAIRRYDVDVNLASRSEAANHSWVFPWVLVANWLSPTERQDWGRGRLVHIFLWKKEFKHWSLPFFRISRVLFFVNFFLTIGCFVAWLWLFQSLKNQASETIREISNYSRIMIPEKQQCFLYYNLRCINPDSTIAVSYTHLTLPTKA